MKIAISVVHIYSSLGFLSYMLPIFICLTVSVSSSSICSSVNATVPVATMLAIPCVKIHTFR